MKAPMTKHQFPSNVQMTNVLSLVIGTCDLVITTKGSL